ncbi:MAG: hypothetical protein VX569_09345 [Pseudomonadota bacterium]|nr:hypothetical protein [Pseudomonadota bacterium]
MAIGSVIAGVLMSTQAGVAPEVGYDELVANRNEAAIEVLEESAIESDDPARLINLGIAYARAGREEDARAMFRAAARSETGLRLEVAGGDWVDSRDLARRALRMLEQGEFAPASRVTMR